MSTSVRTEFLVGLTQRLQRVYKPRVPNLLTKFLLRERQKNRLCKCDGIKSVTGRQEKNVPERN